MKTNCDSSESAKEINMFHIVRREVCSRHTFVVIELTTRA